MSESAFDETCDNFEKLEEAVMSTPRGRWFLREFAKRNRVADTKSVLEQLSEFQSAILDSQSDVRIEVLQTELREMANSITETRADIASLQSDEAAGDHIEAAAGELDAVVDATENATSSILAAAEELQLISEKLRDLEIDSQFCDDIETHTTDIFMACSFQDLTGQRMTKVVNTLRFLEQRVNMMIEVWGVDGSAKNQKVNLSTTAPGDSRPDAELLDGPASDGEGFSQDEIDAMLDGDFSKVNDAELYQAEEKAAVVERRVEAADVDRFEGQDEVESAAPAEVAAEPEAGPEPEDEAAENKTIDQDDIDSLFG